MAYASGTASSATDLQSALTAACTANGWTLTSGVLSKGSNHFRPGLVSTHLQLEMGDSAGFATPGITPATSFPYISLNGTWPVFYRIFITSLNGADTVVLCVQEANAVEYKYLMFGNLENKVGTWVGGQWMHGTYASQTTGGGAVTARQSNAGVDVGNASGPDEGGTMTETYQQAHGAIFAATDQQPNFGSNFTAGNSFLKCDLDGGTYKNNGPMPGGNSTGFVEAFRFLKLPLVRGVNLWNGESCLTPIHVYLGRASSTFSHLGTVGHVRAMRMDNYEPGDIITLGLDKWMVLPMYLRDQTDTFGQKGVFNSTGITGHSGQLAYAFKYDGP